MTHLRLPANKMKLTSEEFCCLLETITEEIRDDSTAHEERSIHEWLVGVFNRASEFVKERC